MTATVLATCDWILIQLDGHPHTYPVTTQPDQTLRTHGWWRISEWRRIPGDSAWTHTARIQPL